MEVTEIKKIVMSELVKCNWKYWQWFWKNIWLEYQQQLNNIIILLIREWYLEKIWMRHFKIIKWVYEGRKTLAEIRKWYHEQQK